MKGWRADHDAVNCLKMYLSDFESTADLKKELNRLYQEDVNQSNQEKFLSVLKNDDYQSDELQEPVREMAYEIIASRVNDNPEIVKEEDITIKKAVTIGFWQCLAMMPGTSRRHSPNTTATEIFSDSFFFR